MRKSKEMPVCVNMAPGVRGDPAHAGCEALRRATGADADGPAAEKANPGS